MTYYSPSYSGMIAHRFKSELVEPAGLSVAIACVAYVALILLAAAGIYCAWKWWRSPAMPQIRHWCRRGMMLVAFLALACAVFLGLTDLIALTNTFTMRGMDPASAIFDETLACILAATAPLVAVSGVACIFAILMGLPAPAKHLDPEEVP